MARPSPIILGLSVLLAALLALALFVIARQRPAGRAPEEPPATTVAQPPAPSAEPRAEDRLGGGASVVARVVPDDASVTPVDSGAGPAPAGRRARLTANHNRRQQEADELAFAALNLPESTRAAIRRLNEEHRQRTEPGPGRPDGPTASETSAALAARADALRLLLGTDAAQTFDRQERAAVGRLRGKYRFEWGRQLRE